MLFDDEPQACNAAEDLLTNKLIRDENLAFVTDGFDEEPSGGADVEDLVDAKTFDKLVDESYSRELEGKELNLNDCIPRIVKRYEEAFREIGLTFHKTRPAKLFLRRMAESPEEMLSGATEERFKRLFASVNEKAEAAKRRNGRPFV